jgi:excisionase family DNA binding protein
MNSVFIQGISLEDLETLIEKKIERGLENFTQRKSPTEPNILLTRKQAAKVLSLSLPTLHKYTLEGLIPCYRIGSTTRYKESEIIKALEVIKAVNHKKGS